MPSWLSSLKSKVDKLDIGRLETTLADLSKLSNVVKNEVVKKIEYNELAKIVNSINTTDTSCLVKKTDYNTKINDIEKKITDHDLDKYITTQEFNRLTAENFIARLKPANLASKTMIADFIKKIDFDDKLKYFNKKVNPNKTRHIEVNTKLEKKLKIISTKALTADLINKYSILNGAKYFSSNGPQNYLIFTSIRKIIFISNENDNIDLWGSIKSTGISQEIIKKPHISNVDFSPKIIREYKLNSRMEFKGMYLRNLQEIYFLHKKVGNLYISHKLDTWSKDLNTDFAQGNCLFGAVSLNKNADTCKYKYSSYDIEFDSRS